MAINYTRARNLYPTLGRESLGQQATGRKPGPTPEAVAVRGSAAKSADVDDALTIGAQASPLVGLLVFVAMAAAIMFAAKRFGEPDGFGNLKASMYNAVMVALIAVTGIPVIKFVFTKVKVPGVSSYVLSV